MNRIIILILLFYGPHVLHAKMNKNLVFIPNNESCPKIQIDTTGCKQDKRIKLTLGIQNLFSTHGTNFKGAVIVVNYFFSPSLSIGLGAEYSYSGYHDDNGMNLYNLKFLPIFIDTKLNVTKNKKITPFVHLATGISFNSYRKEYINAPGIFYNVSEKGMYLYSGVGVSFKLWKCFSSFIDLGFKGFRMSFNDLDINPHGITLRLGLEF
jgi:hypothetical protein